MTDPTPLSGFEISMVNASDAALRELAKRAAAIAIDQMDTLGQKPSQDTVAAFTIAMATTYAGILGYRK